MTCLWDNCHTAPTPWGLLSKSPLPTITKQTVGQGNIPDNINNFLSGLNATTTDNTHQPALRVGWHDDVIKWKHCPRYWPFVWGIHRSPVNSPRKGQWRGSLMFSLICACINGWENIREAGDLSRHRAHYDVTVMVRAAKYKGKWFLEMYTIYQI